MLVLASLLACLLAQHPSFPASLHRHPIPCKVTHTQAPVLFSAAIYLSLTLMVQAFNGAERLLILRPKFVLACKCGLSTKPRGRFLEPVLM
jgi:hypothetical protein